MIGLDPTLSSIVRRGIRRGVLTVRREKGWMTVLGALFGILAVMQLLIVAGLGVQGIEHLLRTRTDLRLEIKSDAQDADIQSLYAALRGLPVAEDVRYVTKEQAYESERQRDPSLISFLEQFKMENPFPDTFSVTLRSLGDYDTFAQFVGENRWSNVVDPSFLSKVTDQEKQAHEMLQLTEAGKSVVLLFIVMMGAVLVFVLIELVRRRSLTRKEEVLVERLVGAQVLSVLIPFATESALLLAGAFLLSIAFLAAFLALLPALVPGLVSGAYALLYAEVGRLLAFYLPIFFVLEAVLIPVIALLGAWWGLRPTLRSSKLALHSH